MRAQRDIEQTASNLTIANAALEKQCKQVPPASVCQPRAWCPPVTHAFSYCARLRSAEQLEERGASLEWWLRDSAGQTSTSAAMAPQPAAGVARSTEKPPQKQPQENRALKTEAPQGAAAQQLGQRPIWAQLFQKLEPRGDGFGTISASRIDAFAKALEVCTAPLLHATRLAISQAISTIHSSAWRRRPTLVLVDAQIGCAESENPKEKVAMASFVRMLRGALPALPSQRTNLCRRPTLALFVHVISASQRWRRLPEARASTKQLGFSTPPPPRTRSQRSSSRSCSRSCPQS